MMQASPHLHNIFMLEAVVHLKDLLFSVVDGALTEALDVAQGADGDTHQNLVSCLDLLKSVEGEALTELAGPLAPYRCQFEFAFLTLVRQAFMQHCLTQKVVQETIDVQLVNDDLDLMMTELVCNILQQVCRNGVVQDQRYFGYQPINKCVLVDQACRQALHELVIHHVRFVPFIQNDQDRESPVYHVVDNALETPSEIFPHHSASNCCTPNPDRTPDRIPTQPPQDLTPAGSGSVRYVEPLLANHCQLPDEAHPERPSHDEVRPERPSPGRSSQMVSARSTSQLRKALIRTMTPSPRR
jgi:hypothetical protein